MNKRTFRFMGACALGSFFLITVVPSCKKSNSSSSSNVFSATVNGSTYTGTHQLGVYDPTFNQIEITGTQVKPGDSSILNLQIPEPIHSHDTITLNEGAEFFYDNYSTGLRFYGDYNQGTGSIIVTSYDTMGHKISGTFSAVLNGYNNGISDSMVITNGHFNTTYTTQ